MLVYCRAQLLNDLELAGQKILVKVGKKEQPALETYLSPEDEESGKRFQGLVDAVKSKVRDGEGRRGGRKGDVVERGETVKTAGKMLISCFRFAPRGILFFGGQI